MVPQGCTLGPTVPLLLINGLSNDVNASIAIITNDTTPFLNVIGLLIYGSSSELESDLWDCVIWFVISNVGKTQFWSFK